MNLLNFFIIHVHDAGRYISPYVSGMPTPNLNRLARESTVFTDAFSCAPTCSPSRAAMLTGYYPHEVGMLGLAHRGFSLSRTDLHAAHLLSAAGWETVLSGVQHETRCWESSGYERFIGVDPEAMFSSGFNADDWDAAQADGVISFLEQRDRNAVKKRPFFLFWGLYNPHRPYREITAAEEAAVKQAMAPGLPAADIPFPQSLPDTHEVRRDFLAYCRAVSAADYQIGRVLDTVLQSSVQENTLLLFTTDHGIPFPGHKCTLYDPGCAVSFIARQPGARLAARGKCRHIVSHLDLVPTIMDYADVRADYQGDGFSLRPLIEGENGHWEQHREAEKIREHDVLFWEINYHAAYEPVRSVRTRKYKYIRRYNTESCPHVIAANIDDSAAKEIVLGHAGWSRDRSGISKQAGPGNRKQKTFSEGILRRTEELYDLATDPLEQRNAADDDAAAGVLREMRTLLNDWMKRTDDPLLKGHVPAPAGAAVDDQDEYSPA